MAADLCKFCFPSISRIDASWQHVSSRLGRKVECCLEYARQQKAKLIVLGVRQASMVTSHVPAHIAYRIITEASCPVLTMAFASQPHATLAAACL
jgi:hypothetical protein